MEPTDRYSDCFYNYSHFNYYIYSFVRKIHKFINGGRLVVKSMPGIAEEKVLASIQRSETRMKEFISTFFICLVICSVAAFVFAGLILDSLFGILIVISFIISVFITIFVKQESKIDELEKKVESFLNN